MNKKANSKRPRASKKTKAQIELPKQVIDIPSEPDIRTIRLDTAEGMPIFQVEKSRLMSGDIYEFEYMGIPCHAHQKDLKQDDAGQWYLDVKFCGQNQAEDQKLDKEIEKILRKMIENDIEYIHKLMKKKKSSALRKEACETILAELKEKRKEMKNGRLPIEEEDFEVFENKVINAVLENIPDKIKKYLKIDEKYIREMVSNLDSRKEGRYKDIPFLPDLYKVRLPYFVAASVLLDSIMPYVHTHAGAM